VIETYLLVSMALPGAAIRRRSSVVALRTACQRLFDILLRASTRVDNLDDMHDAIRHAAARFRHDASARCFVAHRTISMSSVDFCAWQLHFNCHCSISMSASRQLPTEADAAQSRD
jgi:hypothetical protein